MDCSPSRFSVQGISLDKIPWNFGVGCHFLLQGISLTQGSNSTLLIGRFFTTEPPGKPPESQYCLQKYKRMLTDWHFWGLKVPPQSTKTEGILWREVSEHL